VSIVVGLVQARGLRARHLLGLAGIFVLGFSVHLYLPLRAAQNPPLMWADASDPSVFLTMLTTGSANPGAFYNPLGSLDTLRIWLKILTVYPIYELTLFGLTLTFSGSALLWRHDRMAFLMLGAVVLLTSGMISVYGIHDIFNYFLPIYLMATLCLGIAIARVLTWLEQPDSLPFLSGVRLIREPLRSSLALACLSLIPLVLLARNFPHLDRSAHRETRAFADLVFTTVERDAIVLTDFWTWTPLLYEQLINDRARDVIVLPAHSSPDLDLEGFVEYLLGFGQHVYAARRSEDAPGVAIGDHPLHLVAPHVVHSMTTDVAPLPIYKDLLVPRGSLFKIAPPDLAAHWPEVDWSQVDPLAGTRTGLELLAFEQRGEQVRIGEGYELSFAWRLAEPVEQDYWVDILFTDASGGVRTMEGFPLWLASHWLGGGSNPTSRWESGEVIQASYPGYVPGSVEPGRYQIRALLYAEGVREGFLPANGPGVLDGQIILGEIQVLP
jgi:hypothetical protein